MDLLRTAGLILLLLTSGYALMILCFTLPLFRRKKPAGPLDSLPFMSVVVAARNEEQNIRSCLEGILAQDYPSDRFEVIVSDDHSTDRTKAEVLEAGSANPEIRLTFLDATAEEGSGKKMAVARAVRIAEGEWILTTDADTGRGPGWLQSMAGACGRAEVKMVLGPVILEGPALFQQLQSLEFMGVMGLTAGSAALHAPLMCNGANFMYEKKGFEETGGFATGIRYPSGDDQFLLAAFRKKYGGKVITFALRGGAAVTTGAEPSLAGFMNQRMRWVSKSRGYREPAVLAAGVLTYFLNAALLAGILAGMFHHELIMTALACWMLKIAAEFPMVAGMATFFGKRIKLWLYLPAQLFQLIYVPIVGVSGLVLPYRWKGRVIRA